MAKNAANRSRANPATPPTVPPAIGPTLFEPSPSPFDIFDDAVIEDVIGEDASDDVEEAEEVTKKQILLAP